MATKNTDHMKTLGTSTPISAPGVEQILCRLSACRCGCQGQDSWHKPNIRRKVRNVTVTPVPTDAAPGRVEVARGEARMPWGLEPVVAYGNVWSDGSVSSYAIWQLVDIRR